MNIRGVILLAMSFLFIVASSCAFGPSPFKGVMSYRDGRVYLKNHDFYRVGMLPDGWQRMDTRVRTISFYNADAGSSISTDAFCGRTIEGQKIESLGSEILSALDRRSYVSERDIELGERGGQRKLVSGSLDGVGVMVDLVIVRKDGCVFDFYAVMPRDVDPATEAAFEGFFGGFEYQHKRN